MEVFWNSLATLIVFYMLTHYILDPLFEDHRSKKYIFWMRAFKKFDAFVAPVVQPTKRFLVKKLAPSLENKKGQLTFFAILITLALISEQVFSLLGSFSIFISIFTSILYVYSLVVIGGFGLTVLSENIEAPLANTSWKKLQGKISPLALGLIVPTFFLALGSVVTFLMIIIPGIVFVIRTMFVIPHVALHNHTTKEAFKHSIAATTKLTKGHMAFFILFALTTFAFVATSTVISNFDTTMFWLVVLIPLLSILSFITAQRYLVLYRKTLSVEA